MKKYLTKWVMKIYPDDPTKTSTIVNLVKPCIDGSLSYVTMMVADEAWVKKKLGNICLDELELPEIFDKAELCGEEGE